MTSRELCLIAPEKGVSLATGPDQSKTLHGGRLYGSFRAMSANFGASVTQNLLALEAMLGQGDATQLGNLR